VYGYNAIQYVLCPGFRKFGTFHSWQRSRLHGIIVEQQRPADFAPARVFNPFDVIFPIACHLFILMQMLSEEIFEDLQP
jgi:hypothetical protein